MQAERFGSGFGYKSRRISPSRFHPNPKAGKYNGGMIEAPSEADVTFSRTSGSHGEALSAGSRHPWRWRLALEHRTQANPTITATTAASFSYSAQPHKLGQYHCWNREYDINTGEWTTPDAARSSWTHLLSYVHDNPLSTQDPTGLLDAGTSAPHESRVALYLEMLKSKMFDAVGKVVASGSAADKAAALEALNRFIQEAEAQRARTGKWPGSDSPAPNPAPSPKPPRTPAPKPGTPEGGPAPAPAPPKPAPKPTKERDPWDDSCPDVLDDPYLPPSGRDDPPGDGGDDKRRDKCTCEWAEAECMLLEGASARLGIPSSIDMCTEAGKLCVARRAAGKQDCWPHKEDIFAPDGSGVYASQPPNFKFRCPNGVK